MATSLGGSVNSRQQDASLHTNRKVQPVAPLGREAQANRAQALEARLVAIRHKHLSGRPSLAGSRSADYFSKQNRGLRPWTESDTARMATRPEREAREWTTDYALALLDEARPSDGTLPGEATARLLKETTEALSAYTRGMDDGRMDVGEWDAFLSELDDLERALRCVRAVAVAERARKQAS